VFTARYGLNLRVIYIIYIYLYYIYNLYYPSNRSGHYMYSQLNIQQFYVLPAQCIYVFCVDLRINSDYFPIQHSLTGFYNRDGECLLRGRGKIGP